MAEAVPANDLGPGASYLVELLEGLASYRAVVAQAAAPGAAEADLLAVAQNLVVLMPCLQARALGRVVCWALLDPCPQDM